MKFAKSVKIKRPLFVAAVLLAVLLFMPSCVSTGALVETGAAESKADEPKADEPSSPQERLEAAIKRGCMGMISKMPKGSKIAVAIEADNESVEDFISEEVEYLFVNADAGFTTITRKDLALIIKEQVLQASGGFDEETLVNFAKKAGARVLITGSAFAGKLSLKALDTEDTAILAMARESY